MFARTPCLIALLSLACFASAARASDESDVKDAAKAFANALAKGDADQAKQYATSDDVTVAVITNLSPVVSASNRLHDAAVAKYGKDGEELAPNPAANMSDWSKHADESIAKVTGNSATLTQKEEPPKQGSNPPKERPEPLRLKKDGSQWKVDLSTMASPAQMKSTAPRYKAVAQGMNTTTDEINAGKYKTAKEAKAALQQNIQTAYIDLNPLPQGTIRGRGGSGGRGQ